MSIRKLFLLLCVATSMCFGFAWAQEDDVQDEQVLAVVLGEPITVASVLPSEAERKTMRDKAKEKYSALLDYKIQMATFDNVLERIILDYAKRNSIVADPDLTQQFENKFGGEFARNQKEGTSKSIQEIAKLEVIKFLVEKALYAEFGGRVIFRQSNPQMPVDAYRTLLAQYKENKQLTFDDESLETAFWDGFSEPFQYEVPAENVSFSKPWWL